MPLTAIYANLACSDLGRSRAWFATLFGREPDAAPMEGLVEWHHGEGAGFQLSAEGEDDAKAGRGTLTPIVSDLRGERSRLAALSPGRGGARRLRLVRPPHRPRRRPRGPGALLSTLA